MGFRWVRFHRFMMRSGSCCMCRRLRWWVRMVQVRELQMVQGWRLQGWWPVRILSQFGR